MVQIIKVSIMVPSMETRPCSAGISACAAAAAIGALPRPASFEKMPRAIPFCMAISMAPIAPPETARIPKALCTTVTNAPGIAEACVISIISARMIYRTAIKGTINSATFEIRCRPPMMTSPAQTVMTTAEITTDQE